MEPRTSKQPPPAKGRSEQRAGTIEQMVYEVDTPRWRQYYQRVRRTIRFPRYYKKEENW